MTSMAIQAALAVLLLFTATVKADFGVTFWKEYVTMTCPANGTWYHKAKDHLGVGHTFQFKYDNHKKGLYHCEEDNKKHYFYVQGKVCENCFELNAALFALAVVADMSVTAFVMMIICMCIRKKSSAGLTHTPKAPAHSGGRGPPVPSPDYEQLSAHTRSKDTYAFVNRTG